MYDIGGFHQFSFFGCVFFVFFSTGLVRLLHCWSSTKILPDCPLVAAGFKPTSLSLRGGCLNRYPILTPQNCGFMSSNFKFIDHTSDTKFIIVMRRHPANIVIYKFARIRNNKIKWPVACDPDPNYGLCTYFRPDSPNFQPF